MIIIFAAKNRRFARVSGADPVHCLVMAGKLFEQEQFDLEDCEDLDDALPQDVPSFNIEDYKDTEMAVLEAMNYCLFDFEHSACALPGKKRKRKKRKKKAKGT